MPRWTVYSRADCSLCEQMLDELAQMLGREAAASVQVVDIDGQPELERRYGSRIPVLTADDEFVCAYRLDVERVNGLVPNGLVPGRETGKTGIQSKVP